MPAIKPTKYCLHVTSLRLDSVINSLHVTSPSLDSASYCLPAIKPINYSAKRSQFVLNPSSDIKK